MDADEFKALFGSRSNSDRRASNSSAPWTKHRISQSERCSFCGKHDKGLNVIRSVKSWQSEIVDRDRYAKDVTKALSHRRKQTVAMCDRCIAAYGLIYQPNDHYGADAPLFD